MSGEMINNFTGEFSSETRQPSINEELQYQSKVIEELDDVVHGLINRIEKILRESRDEVVPTIEKDKPYTPKDTCPKDTCWLSSAIYSHTKNIQQIINDLNDALKRVEIS